MKRICIFGASSVWGVGDTEEGGWVDRLKKYFAGKDKTRVYNLGVPGDNSEKLLKRFVCECEARNPDVIIIGIGTNDSQYIGTKDNSRVSLEKFTENVTQLYTQALQFTDQIFFIGLTPVDETKTMPWKAKEQKYYDNDNIKKYNGTIENFCKQHNVPYVEVFSLIGGTDKFDGLHPNSKGHEKIYRKVLGILVKGN